MSERDDIEQAFWDELVGVVDGEPELVEKYADLMADSLEHRDARFEAEQAVRHLAEAGDDWELPEDLEDQLVAAIAAQHHELSGSRVAPVADEAAPTPEPKAAEPQMRRAPEPRPRPRRHLWLAGGVAAAAAAAVLAVTSALVLTGDDGPAGVVAGALSARVLHVARAADDGHAGAEMTSPDGSALDARQGAELPPGTTLRTDDRTRIQLELSDGSTVVLNHGTEVTLSAEAPRQLVLRAGELVADVAHLPDGPRALLATPSGRIEVLGTKLALTATDEATSVRVARGAVLAHPLSGEAVDVEAGEEGLLTKTGQAVVAPAMNLAEAVGWSELDGPVEGAIPGLGELRARRPGEREDQERPLSLASHRVNVRIVGNVARTEIEQTFENDGPHVLEGIYRFPLPPDARIASLALDVEGQWEEGAFVSRERARRIWRGVIRNATPEAARVPDEEFIWVPGPWRDPALLEWQRGGQFELRIFPIPARGARSIRLAYTQNIGPAGAGRRYSYPLPWSGDDSTRVGRFEATVEISGADPATPPRARGYTMTRSDRARRSRLSFEAADFLPSGDLIVDYRGANDDAELRWWTYSGRATVAPAERSREGEPAVVAAQREIHADERGYAVFALRPDLPAWGRGEARDYVLVLDASQSMVGERWQRASKLAVRIVAEMDRRDRFLVLACDATCRVFETPADGATPSAETSTRLSQWLDGIRPAGASDLVRALREAARARPAGGDRRAHVIYVGDGMPSTGHRRPASIAAEVTPLAEDPKLSFSTVGIGVDADALVLGAVARAGGGHHVPYRPGQRLGAAALAVLETTFGAALEDARLVLPEGITAVAPARLPTIRAGEEVLVVGRMTGDSVRGEVLLTGKVGGRPFEEAWPVELTTTTSAGNAFVPRQWAAGTIEELELAGKASERPRIVALSKAFGVMSRQTSLLVLESEAMFRAFGVDRSEAALRWTGDTDVVQGSAGREDRHTAHADGDGSRILSADLQAQLAQLGYSQPGQSVSRLRENREANEQTAVFNFSGEYWRDELGHYRQGVGARGGDESASRGPRRLSDLERRVDELRDRTLHSEERRLHLAAGEEGEGEDDADEDEAAPVDTAGTETVADARGQFVDDRTRAADPAAANRETTEIPPVGRRSRGSWMRRQWYTVGRVVSGGVRSVDLRRVGDARTALAERPDSRDRHRALSRALSRAGHVELAEEAVQGWIERDQLDPEALTLLSDAVGRAGDRDRAVRLLSGIVDLRPDDVVLHSRLARAFDRADAPKRACAHRVALAEIQHDDDEVVAAAVRCERALEREAGAGRVLAAVADETVRARVETLAAEPAPRDRLRGVVTLDATWEGESDVDLTLVTPQGTRLSWMGGRTTVVGTDGSAIGHETLGLRRARRGSYVVEVSRTDPADVSPVSGTIRIRAYGQRRTVPFAMTSESHIAVARVEIERHSRMVPMQ